MTTLQIRVFDFSKEKPETVWTSVEGWRFNTFFGAHHRVCGNGELDAEYYTLTHLPSGYSLGQYYRRLRDAKTVAEKLTALPVDWTATEKVEVGTQADAVFAILNNKRR